MNCYLRILNPSTSPYKIAITGGIGSGKSVVSRLFRIMGIPVYDCDARAKHLMNTDRQLREALVDAISEAVYDAHGTLDRSYLASYMFGCPERVAQVNSIVHPAVRADFGKWAIATGAPVVAVETAILYESGMDADVDAVCVVSAPLELRLHRAMLRDGADESAVRRRMESQMDDEELLRRATYIIYNDDKQPLIGQVSQLLRKIMASRF